MSTETHLSGVKEEVAEIDFETRSACSIKDAGSWRYSLDPTTEVLCMAYRLPYWDETRTALWHPAFPHLGIEEAEFGGATAWDDLEELFAWIQSGGLVEAHNAWFERGIWVNILAPNGWPTITWHQWRCSAAKAAAHAMPRKLEGAGEALGNDIQKDGAGHDLMLAMCKPRKPKQSDWKAWGIQHAPCETCAGVGRIPSLKKDGTPTIKGLKCPMCIGRGSTAARESLPAMPLRYRESRTDLEDLFIYCRIDVLAEAEISHRLPDLTEQETLVYLLDQRINERGFHLDREGIHAALALVDAENTEYNAELCAITGGAVERATQRARIVTWLTEHGLDLPDTQGDTIDGFLERRDLYPEAEDTCWRVLELMRALGRSSTAKFVTMLDMICPDDRVHGSMLYHGATTGRWSGSGVQPHNFPRGVVKIEDMEDAWRVIKTRDKSVIESHNFGSVKKPSYGNVMEVLSSALRGAIIPRPWHQFYVADFAAIEARVVNWLAEDDDALDIFRSGKDVYCELASKIYERAINKHDHPNERQLGKAGELGLGFQMGPHRFVESAAGYGIELQEDVLCQHAFGEQTGEAYFFNGDRCLKPSWKHKFEDHDFEYAPGDEDLMTAAKVVGIYRDTHWRIVAMWKDQEEAAIKAVNRPGSWINSGRMYWIVEGDFLYCELPSGRRLSYPYPEIHSKVMPWGKRKPVLTFMGINVHSRQWERQSAYGGLIVENQTQAVARDLMAAAIVRLEAHGVYQTVLSVHDEDVAEAPIGVGSVEEFVALVAAVPDWADGLPVEAEGWAGTRYRK